MRQLVWLVTIVTAAVVVAGQDDDGYTDENRPYKFGFNIQGHQHRKEEKDENGIINGEYGFITADGYYRVTVYKTDEKGDFKIVSMKNYYVGFPPEDPTTTPEPERARNPIRKLAFPSQAAAAPAIPARPLKIAPQPPLTTTTAAPTQLPATATFTGAPACSSCFLPPTTAKPSPSVISNSSPKKPSSVIAQNGPKPGFLQQNQGVKPGSPTFPRNPSLGSSNLVGPLPNNGASSGGKPGSDPGLTPDRRMPQGPQGSVPNTRVPPRPSSQSNQPIQQGSRPLRPLGQSQPGSKQNIPLVQDNQPFRPIGQVNQGTPPSQNNRESFGPIGQVNQGTPPSQNNRESFGPIGQVNQGTPPSQNSRERDQAPQKLGPRVEDPSAAKQSTSTQGGAGEENGLLYRFNYTVGFHGHHEDGYRNGDKTGDYFVSGRDGVSRKVEYLANEFGYQPNITLVQLDRSDERVPKEESEKNYGLKGYEFKWFLRK